MEEEIKLKSAVLNGESEPEPVDYVSLTGLDMLAEFESNLRESSEEEDDFGGSHMCRALWYGNKKKENGAVGMLVSALLDLETRCNELAPWERNDIPRRAWTSNLRDTVSAWKRGNTLHLGPSHSDEENETIVNKQMETVSSREGRKKLGNGNMNTSAGQLVTALKVRQYADF